MPSHEIKALADIAFERKRQQDVEGWTPEHDDEHRDGALSAAAASYAYAASNTLNQRRGLDVNWRGKSPSMWPWSPSWWKYQTPRRALVKAGALIVAEIERLDRAAGVAAPSLAPVLAVGERVVIKMRHMGTDERPDQWYFDGPDLFCDVERDPDGKWSVYIRDMKTGQEGWDDQAERPCAPPASTADASVAAEQVGRYGEFTLFMYTADQMRALLEAAAALVPKAPALSLEALTALLVEAMEWAWVKKPAEIADREARAREMAQRAVGGQHG